MKASRQNAADILVYMLLSMGVLGWSLTSLYGIDLVSEPFGPIMVIGQSVFSLAALTAAYQFIRRQSSLVRQTVRVRGRRP